MTLSISKPNPFMGLQVGQSAYCGEAEQDQAGHGPGRTVPRENNHVSFCKASKTHIRPTKSMNTEKFTIVLGSPKFNVYCRDCVNVWTEVFSVWRPLVMKMVVADSFRVAFRWNKMCFLLGFDLFMFDKSKAFISCWLQLLKHCGHEQAMIANNFDLNHFPNPRCKNEEPCFGFQWFMK